MYQQIEEEILGVKALPRKRPGSAFPGGKKPDNTNKDLADDKPSLAMPKKKRPRVSYTNTWQNKVLNTDSNLNPNRDDFQSLSNQIRPANTIYKSRVKTDYKQSAGMGEDGGDEDY